MEDCDIIKFYDRMKVVFLFPFLICHCVFYSTLLLECDGRTFSLNDDSKKENDHQQQHPRHRLGRCEAGCRSDWDCQWGLDCLKRSGNEIVSGCVGRTIPGINYCILPIDDGNTLVLKPNSNNNAESLGLCEGNCGHDNDCKGDLFCYKNKQGNAGNVGVVPGCIGTGAKGASYCYRPPEDDLHPDLELVASDGEPSSAYPLQECQGRCISDRDCARGLICSKRCGDEPVETCSGTAVTAANYCITSPADRHNIDNIPRLVTYRPGVLVVRENGLLLSGGLTSRVIATKNTRVQYDTGGISFEEFHTAPDGAAVFANEQTGGWIYVSNSENKTDGGVGAITFNANGEVIGYKRILRDTKRNCGGGKTFWNTWMTCEEIDGGQVWEVDPWGRSPGRQTIMGRFGAEYESAAYDNRNPDKPTFYITVDEVNGPLVRFHPDENAVATARSTGDYTNLLHTTGNTVKYEYFKVETFNSNTGTGTFSWTTNIDEGKQSAENYYRHGEGIDIRNGIIYFTSKLDKYLLIIDIDNETFTRTSTVSGAFDSQPDQVARLLDSVGSCQSDDDDILYFCEDGGNECGVHGRDSSGRFFTILQDEENSNLGGETTGLAFSPNGLFMYVSFQKPGHIFEIRRTDGLPFNGQRLDIKYHSNSNSNSQQTNNNVHNPDGTN